MIVLAMMISIPLLQAETWIPGELSYSHGIGYISILSQIDYYNGEDGFDDELDTANFKAELVDKAFCDYVSYHADMRSPIVKIEGLDGFEVWPKEHTDLKGDLPCVDRDNILCLRPEEMM